jgi:hypothetical protein
MNQQWGSISAEVELEHLIIWLLATSANKLGETSPEFFMEKKFTVHLKN